MLSLRRRCSSDKSKSMFFTFRILCRHGRAWPGHPRLSYLQNKTWMPGTSPGMTAMRLQPQHRLGDDVALDLVGAAVDRDLAVIKIARRDLRGPFHLLVAALVAVHVIGGGERADHFHQQFGGGLLDFRAFYLQHRRGRIGLALAVLVLVGDD